MYWHPGSGFRIQDFWKVQRLYGAYGLLGSILVLRLSFIAAVEAKSFACCVIDPNRDTQEPKSEDCIKDFLVLSKE